MTLYTGKVIAEWLGLTERRVRQLRDEGIISEVRPGFYALRPTVTKYILYIRKGSHDLNAERTALTRAKREAAQMENDIKRGELHRTEDIEKGIKTLLFNIRSKFLSLPAKLSPVLAAKRGNQADIYDELNAAICETLAELSDYKAAFAADEDDGDEETETA